MNASRLFLAASSAVSALALLALWAAGSGRNVALPVYQSLPLGMAAIAFGLALVAAGLFSRWGEEGEYPHHPWPPVRRVDRGIYRVIPHPIAAGFCLLCFGAALSLGSPGGLWLVTPMAVLAAFAWWMGRGEDPRPGRTPSFLHVPADDDLAPDWSDRWSVGILVLLAWLGLYEAVMALGIPRDALSLALPLERDWPVLEWTELFYIGTYPFVMAVPFVLGTRRQLLRFTREAWAAMAINLPLFLLLPFISPPRPFTPQTWLGDLLLWERKYDAASNAFPSFHVTWAILSALAYSRAWPRWKWLWWALGSAIAASTVTTGMHTLADVAAGVAVCWAVTRLDRLRAGVGRAAEQVAGAWRRAPVGPFVLHHHGLFAGLGALIATGVAGVLWARAGVLVPRTLAEGWSLAACLAIAAPWGWAAFRLRGLVREEGRRFVPPNLLSFLAWDLAIGLFLLRLWSLDAPPSLIAGIALMLAGCGGFVEERGDPSRQRRAVLAFAAGAVLSAIPTAAAFPPPGVSGWALAAALGAGGLAVILLGVEFRLPGKGEGEAC